MAPVVIIVALLLASALVIYLSCEFFVNGVEWVGRRLGVGETATGTILAAFGTALPESVVTFVAVAFGVSKAQKDLGVGAALGGPLVLATIAYAVVGGALIASGQRFARSPDIARQFNRLSRDQGWFLLIFIAKIVLGLVAFAFKPWLGLAFFAAYGLYFWVEMRGGADGGPEVETLGPLKFAPNRPTPPTWLAIFQTGLALMVIFIASRVFVMQLDALGPELGIHPQLLALLLSPIATELPEIMNAVIWVRQGKHRLALANISGAMMIQATVPTGLGLIFTPWLFDRSLILSGAITLAAVGALFIAFRRGRASRAFLVGLASLYVVFVILLLAFHLQS